MRKLHRIRILIISLIFLLVALLIFFLVKSPDSKKVFDPARALQDVQAQVEMGPRTPGSEGHAAAVKFITKNLTQAGWQVELQTTEKMGLPISNIIAKRGKGSEWVIIGAHYDTRFYADMDLDPTLAKLPVPGANDGASGVAVLLELARSIPADLNKETWLVFFDTEDQGDLSDWDWSLGASAFVESLTKYPDKVVIIDMIGDADLNVYREESSDAKLKDDVWQIAAKLGYGDKIINEEKYSILDDHLPFINAGIPAIDMIDFDYPYWHTSQDTLDKVSEESLRIIGLTLLEWLTQ